MASLSRYGLTVAIVAAYLTDVSGIDDSCPAGAGSSCSKPTMQAVSSRQNRSTKVNRRATAELIGQEVDELNSYIQLCKKRIELLKDLKRTVASGKNLSIPESHVRLLQERVPLVSVMSVEENKAPHSSADDFLTTKAVLPQEHPVSLIDFLALRNPSSSPSSPAQTAMPSALLVALQADGAMRLFSPSGEMVLSFSSGHDHPVTNLAVSPSHDEYFIATADAGAVIRVHKINVRQRWLTREQKHTRRNSMDEKASQYVGSQVNVTAQFTKQIRVRPGKDAVPARITAFTVASHQGTKYFVTGDVEGRITMFTRNGTLAATINVSSTLGSPVEGLYSHLSSLVFRAESRWGFINLERFEVQRLKCPKFKGRVTAAIVDSHSSSRVLIADEAGTVWVFNTRERKHCKAEHRFPIGATLAPLELASVRGYTIALERVERGGDAASIVALNMSHAGKKSDELIDAPSAVVWRKGRPAVRDWVVHKRYQQGDLLAFLSEDGYEIEVMELLMQIYQPPSSENFTNYQLPVVALAIVVILGYQYMKGKFGGSEKFEMEKAMKGLKGKKKRKNFQF